MYVVGRKLNTTGTDIFPATRSVVEMLNNTDWGLDKMAGKVPEDPNPRMAPKYITLDKMDFKAG